ncbi:MAG: signal peptidase I [Patescibacteria group bacterium]
MSQKNLALESFFQRKFGPLGASIILFIMEVVQIILISSAIIIPIRYFLIQPFYVKGASMEPNFYDQEYLIIDELTWRTRAPVRGEIVVFRYPRDPSQYFIKRVIGLPGETVQVSDGHVTIFNTDHPNGIFLTESYLGDVLTSGTKKVTLGSDEYYVLGDNRGESMDSRIFGAVNRDQFIGRVWVRGLPINRIATFPLPIYNL